MEQIEGVSIYSFPIRYEKKPIVYLITDNIGSIKIGKTNDISRRLRDLQTGNANVLGIIALFECGSMHEATKLEEELHNHFSFCKLIGEWFSIEPVKQWLIENNDITSYWNNPLKKIFN